MLGFSRAENNVFWKWVVSQTGDLKKEIWQKSSFIPSATLLVSDRHKNENAQNTNVSSTPPGTYGSLSCFSGIFSLLKATLMPGFII